MILSGERSKAQSVWYWVKYFKNLSGQDLEKAFTGLVTRAGEGSGGMETANER